MSIPFNAAGFERTFHLRMIAFAEKHKFFVSYFEFGGVPSSSLPDEHTLTRFLPMGHSERRKCKPPGQVEFDIIHFGLPVCTRGFKLVNLAGSYTRSSRRSPSSRITRSARPFFASVGDCRQSQEFVSRN